MRKTISLVLLILLLLNTGSAQTTHEFNITLTDDSNVKLSDYDDKPIMIDWAANWCATCEKNQQNMQTVYDEYKDDVNFLTVVYPNSNNDLADVKAMKSERGHPWPFGYDTGNYASGFSASNGDTWFLFANRTISASYDYRVLTPDTIRNELNKMLGRDTVEVDDTGALPDLFTNPLFLGFAGLSVVAILYLGIKRTQTQ